eukprot:CAMPEP_0202910330 /NCGR_PEP_ID=MMETSP1392-20130828/51722_1 /ASSEMBLY_ACC=CAM_ASM_000868 /TAXON_ID=225041 /ORGANISM="Chlamydomonas chlamydogama, Strain SAG 11-48b" /LENGTH=105 /DNA_ID=CAMNT_0049600401 /DNA_START=767 /DNA_END=1084 /DNA_ORIENTATION=+
MATTLTSCPELRGSSLGSQICVVCSMRSHAVTLVIQITLCLCCPHAATAVPQVCPPTVGHGDSTTLPASTLDTPSFREEEACLGCMDVPDSSKNSSAMQPSSSSF